jgi:PAS domain S-box-containing protein
MKTGNTQSKKKKKASSDDTCPAKDLDKLYNTTVSTGVQSAGSSEEKYRILFENMAPGVFYQRRDGSLFDVNPAAIKMFGLPYDQFIGKDSYDPQWKVVSETGEVLTPEQHPSMIALLTGKPVRDMVVGVFNPERNDITWIKANATPMFRPGEIRPYQVFVTMDDITELRGAHVSLTESEEKFRELFTRMPAAVAIYEAIGDGEDFIFRDFNAAAEAIEGIKKSDLVGKRVSEVFPGVIEFGLFDVFRRVLKSGEAEFYPAAVYRDQRDPGTWRENWVYKLASGEIIAIYHDITERKRAEEEIEKAYALVNETQAISRVGGWEYDLATKRITWTDEVYRIHGVGMEFDPNDITRNVGFYAPGDREVLQEAFRCAVEHGEPYDLELELLPADGGRIWVRTIGRPVKAGDRTIRISGNIIDITNSKTAEAALRESEERFSNAFGYAAIGMALISLEGRWLKANQSICEIVGYSENELQGMTFQDITHPDDLDLDLEYVRQMIAGEIRTYQMEKRYYHKLGHIVWVLLSVSMVRDTQRKPLYFISQIENITERKRAEEALKESEERLRQIAENIPVVYYVHDRASNIFIYVSPAYEKVWGRTCQELYENPYSFLEAVHPDDLPSVQEAIRMEIEEGKYFDGEYRIIQPDGEIRWVHSRNFPILDKHGTAYRVIGVAEDITGRKFAENALQESEEKLALVMDGIQTLIAYVDKDLRYVYMNKAYADWYGQPREELIGKRISDLLEKGVFERALPSYQAVLRGEEVSLENNVRDTEGKERFVSVRLVPYFIGKEVSGFFASVMDITGHKQAEKSLAESEAKFRTMVEASPDMIWEIDTQGNFTYISSQSRVQL